ncbi:aldo/keto reductase [Polaromonas sp. SM01]|uniref:aldo/keto reductase n=1 Tax=Polaromonas sp. SM01 TaxID=3085630 RepID=UPI0029825DFF|nr:aldo/keto reductase [Polaromonas sp. SM01]MDW5442532.1 aldo/keto reductase [Polaromonas sp. SM01]
MQYRRLGTSNLKVSALCLGTMMFGQQTPADEAARIMASAREHGINFIDTADVYNEGRAETLLGQLLAGQRDHWVLASKLGNRMGQDVNAGHYSRRWLIQQTDAILARLGTDYLDILYLHRDFHDENLEEAVSALGHLIRAGKIRSFGLSNFRGWRIAEIMRLCEKIGVPQPVVCQPYYNLLNRGPEVEILPACGHYGLGVVPYSPLARGVLTGKYPPGQPPAEGTRAGSGDKRILETEFREESLLIAQKIKARCDAKGWVPGQFAAAWVLANPLVSSVIAGPRLLSHLEDVYGATDLVLDREDEAFVNELVIPGHASSHGYNDPSYPFFGRPVG